MMIPVPAAEAALYSPDEDPVSHAIIQRTASLTEKQWDKFLSSDYAQTGSSSTDPASFTSAKGSAPVRHNSGLLRRKYSTLTDMESSGRDVVLRTRSARSIFGLPLLNPLSRSYKIWSSFILLLDLTYTAIMIPMIVAFELPDVGWGWGCIINLVAGFFFIMDMLLSFHVGFVGKLGVKKKLIMDGKAVAWYYIARGQFVVDTITVIAWLAQILLIILDAAGVNLSSSVTMLYQIIRILRIIRFVSLMRRLSAMAIAAGGRILPGFDMRPHHAYFLNLVYGGLAILSFLSCLMNFVARKQGCNNSWVNKFGVYVRDYGSPESQDAGILTPPECQSIPDRIKWLGGAYWMLVTMLSIGYGDITPQSTAEIVVAMFCMIAGIVFFGILLGSIAETLTDLNQESKRIARYRARMEIVDKWMGKHHLPAALRHRIGQHYQEVWIADAESLEEVQIMKELPHRLRREVAYAVNTSVFKQLQLFHDFPTKEQMAIASMMMAVQLPAGATMCEVDDPADSVWLLHEGSVAEVTPDGTEINMKTAPALLGETALLRDLDEEHCFRPCALRTRQMCLLWVLPMRDLLPLLRKNPTLYHRAVQQAVPKQFFDYLLINPIAMDTGGGVAPGVPPRGGRSGGGGFNGMDGASLPSFRTTGTESMPRTDTGLTSPRKSGSSRSLSSAKSRKPSWTALQEQHPMNQRSDLGGQLPGFNGLVAKK